MEGLKYTSPTVHGFILDASIGEALKYEGWTVDNPTGGLTNLGRVVGVNLKYAGEHHGYRLAAGVGAEWSKSNEDNSLGYISTVTTIPVGSTSAGITPTNASADNVYWAGALSLMHVPQRSVCPRPLYEAVRWRAEPDLGHLSIPTGMPSAGTSRPVSPRTTLALATPCCTASTVSTGTSSLPTTRTPVRRARLRPLQVHASRWHLCHGNCAGSAEG